MTRFRPFPPVSCRYGAPLGRVSAQPDPDTPLDQLAVAGPAGEYGKGADFANLQTRLCGFANPACEGS
jgi:hypothetical protein